MGIPAQNVLDYGAAGDGNHVDGSGTDDTTALQNAINAAVVDGVGMGTVAIPGNRTYVISSSLTVPLGIEIIGVGGRNGAGTAAPPTITWNGAAGGIMMLVEATIANIPSVKIANLILSGRTDGTNRPANCIVFRRNGGGAASLDSGSELDRVMFQVTSGDGVRIEGAATNFSMWGCRWDGVRGYGIYANSGVKMALYGHCTWTGGDGEKGFIFLDGESDSGVECMLEIYSITTEVNTDLAETYAGGTNPLDKRGMIRLGVSSGSTVSHKVRVYGFKHAHNAAKDSYSIFQVTGATPATDLAASRCVNVLVEGGENMTYLNVDDTNADGEVSFVGGRVPYGMRPPRGCLRTPRLSFGIGMDSASNHTMEWTHAAIVRVAGLAPEPKTFANLPTTTGWLGGGQIWTCTDVPNSIALGAAVSTGGGGNTRPLWGEHNGSGGFNWYLMGRAT